MLSALFQKPIAIITIMFATVPLQEIIRLEGSTITLLPILTFILIIKTLIKYNSLPKQSTIYILLLGVVTTSVSFFRWGTVITPLVFLMTWILPLFALKLKKEIAEHKSVLAYSFIISMLTCIVASQIFPTAAKVVNSGLNTEFYRFQGFSNAWSYGLNSVLAASFCVVMMYHKRKHYIVYIVLIFVFLTQAIMSGTYSVLLGMCLVLFALFNLILKKHKWLWLLFLPIFVMLIILIYTNFIQIRGVGVDDNGRFEIWDIYLRNIFGSMSLLFFGAGGGCVNKLGQSFGTVTAHNGLLELLAETGLTGIVITSLYIKKLIKDNLTHSVALYLWLPISCNLLFLLTQGGITSYSIALLFVFAIASQKEGVQNEAINTEKDMTNKL